MPNGLSKICREWALRISPPEFLLISEWADKFAYLPEEGNAESGKYKCSRMPYQREMLNDPLDYSVVETYWMIGSQLGKTLCIILIIEYHIDHAPTAILIVYPTLDSVTAWMRDKFIPTTKATPRLKGKLKEPRAKDSESTTLNRKFPAGNLTGVGANSVSGLRQRSKKIVICDEIDAMLPTVEGDPLMLADKRAETFHDAVKLKSSTPSKKETSRIEEGWERSDKQRYFLPCWKCGGLQWLKHSNFIFSFKQPDGSEKRDTENAIFRCEHCGCDWTDQQRLAAIASGHPDNPPVHVMRLVNQEMEGQELIEDDLRAEWMATAPFKGVRGRHLSGYYQTIGKKRAFKNFHHQFAENFLEAKHKGEEALEVWTNTFLAETFAPKMEQVEWTPLLDRAEEYDDELPYEVCLLTAAVDIQKDRAEIEVEGWGDEEENWGIEKRVVWGDFDLPETQAKVEDILSKKYKHPSGIEIGITAASVDTGHKTKAAYRFCKRNATRRFYAVKGSSTPNSPLVTPHKNKHYGIWLYSVGTDTAKDSLFSRLKIEESGPRFIHFPKGRGYNEAYFKQLCSEKLQTYLEKGVVRRKWVKSFERNEALDLRVYNLAAFDILKPNMAKIRAAVIPREQVQVSETVDYAIRPTPPPEPPPIPSPMRPRGIAPARPARNGGGFVGRGRGWM